MLACTNVRGLCADASYVQVLAPLQAGELHGGDHELAERHEGEVRCDSRRVQPHFNSGR